jgi:hypothetical protein
MDKHYAKAGFDALGNAKALLIDNPDLDIRCLSALYRQGHRESPDRHLLTAQAAISHTSTLPPES